MKRSVFYLHLIFAFPLGFSIYHTAIIPLSSLVCTFKLPNGVWKSWKIYLKNLNFLSFLRYVLRWKPVPEEISSECYWNAFCFLGISTMVSLLYLRIVYIGLIVSVTSKSATLGLYLTVKRIRIVNHIIFLLLVLKYMELTSVLIFRYSTDFIL